MLKRKYHNEGVNEVSVNDVFSLVDEGLLDPPPKPPSEKTNRGVVMANMFNNTPTYENTGKKVQSIVPEHKKRKVCVFRYIPEEDFTPEDELILSDLSSW